MIAAVFASIIESVGDYYACAKVAGKLKFMAIKIIKDINTYLAILACSISQSLMFIILYQ